MTNGEFFQYRGYQVFQHADGYSVMSSGSTVHIAKNATAARNWIDAVRMKSLNDALDDLQAATQ